MNKLTFTITPNANGYVVGCHEIPTLFTDVGSVAELDRTLRNLLHEYVDGFPDDALRRGIDKNTSLQMIWRASPNSVSLE